MSHSIAESRSRNPMWFYEQNFLLLSSLVNNCDLQNRGKVTLLNESMETSFKILERTPYTLLIEINSRLQETNNYVADIGFQVRIYMDACLAEVVRYQGFQRLQPKYTVPNKNMFQPDEKRQSNLLLHDWLTTYTRLNNRESFITTV